MKESPTPPALTPPQVQGLAVTQKSFLEYQLQAFGQRSPSFFALELAGEVGELANLEKKIWRDPERDVELAKLSDEAADVFIALMNYWNARGVALETAVSNKLEKIEQRRCAGAMGPLARS